VEAVHSAGSVLVVCHINPDGDALGSLLAVVLGLESLGKRVVGVSVDGVPEVLRFLPHENRVQTHTRERFDLAIVVDSGDLSRVGAAKNAVLSSGKVIDVDHHVTPGAFGDIRLLDGTASATAEIVYDLLFALGVSLTPEMATCLLCGLMTDTGSFRFSNVTPRTLAIGAQLVQCGASPSDIGEAVFENRSWASQKLLGRALETMRQTPDGKIVWAVVRAKDFEQLGGTDAETEGIVSVVRSVRGAHVAALLREMPNGRLRVSLRARPPADVGTVAAQFGGGGHRLASGCSLDGPLEQAETILIAALNKALDNSGV
jgi:phosphoesterase RecJ-like protein